jgi:magnesium-transporting ATPase (P-type)
VLKAGGVIESRWEALRIGDIIRIKNNEFFPADVVLL